MKIIELIVSREDEREALKERISRARERLNELNRRRSDLSQKLEDYRN